MENVSKSFGDRVVLDGVDLSVDGGETVVVRGPNGSGKSTLLRCLAGSETADEGRVLYRGSVLDESDSRVRAALAVLLDDVDFFPDLSVVEHLRLFAWAHGQGSAERTAELVLDELELSPAKDQLPATLSSGQRHRLALASCFVRPREALVLDEPEQRLDSRGREWLARRLVREARSGVAVVLASHDQDLTRAVADRLLDVTA